MYTCVRTEIDAVCTTTCNAHAVVIYEMCVCLKKHYRISCLLQPVCDLHDVHYQNKSNHLQLGVRSYIAIICSGAVTELYQIVCKLLLIVRGLSEPVREK
jgi:hypothetical protein